MKSVVLLLFILPGIIFFFSCDDDSNSVTPAAPDAGISYFPPIELSFYKYDIEETDSSGNPAVAGRSSFYIGSQIISGTPYRIQHDTINSAGGISSSSLYFRVSDQNEIKGLFYFIDTAALASVLPPVVDFSYDPEMRILLFPLNTGSSWTVFQMTAEGTTAAPVDLKADYEGKEVMELNLNGRDTVVTAVKIRFTMTILLPPPGVIFNAVAWLAEDIGFIKWEGNGAVINLLASGLVDLGDTATVSRQVLKEYRIP